MKPSEYAKAIVGAILAGLTALGTAVVDGNLDAVEWIGIAAAVVATFGTVFRVPNAFPITHRTIRRRDQHGHIGGDWLQLLALVFFIAFMVWLIGAALGDGIG